MTLETARIMQTTLKIMQVEVAVANVHEMNAVETKIRKHGLIKQRTYIDDVDQWNRPTTIKATYLVFVKSKNRQPFKAMITQQNKNTESEISFKDITRAF